MGAGFVWKPPYVAKTYGGAYRGGYHGKACGKLAATGGYAVVGVGVLSLSVFVGVFSWYGVVIEHRFVAVAPFAAGWCQSGSVFSGAFFAMLPGDG